MSQDEPEDIVGPQLADRPERLRAESDRRAFAREPAAEARVRERLGQDGLRRRRGVVPDPLGRALPLSLLSLRPHVRKKLAVAQ
jgi:hypothetical protein